MAAPSTNQFTAEQKEALRKDLFGPLITQKPRLRSQQMQQMISGGKGTEQKHEEPYHEKQKLQLCLLHALNTLIGHKAFTKKRLTDICKQLHNGKWNQINPHKSVLGTGNYDANVLNAALDEHFDIQWYDERQRKKIDVTNEYFLQPLDKGEFQGFILNSPEKSMLSPGARHWFSITFNSENDLWYNNDSKLDKAVPFENPKAVTKFLKCKLKYGAQLMICRWRKKDKTKFLWFEYKKGIMTKLETIDYRLMTITKAKRHCIELHKEGCVGFCFKNESMDHLLDENKGSEDEEEEEEVLDENKEYMIYFKEGSGKVTTTNEKMNGKWHSFIGRTK